MSDLRNGWGAESTKRLPISSRRPVRHDERGVRHGIWAGLLRWIPLTPLLLMLTVSGQQPPAPGPRAYDVCSVKPSSADAQSTIFPTAGNGFTAISQSVESLIESALDRRWFQVFGVPAWAKSDYYDVACKDTEGDSLKEPFLPRMRSGLQALLADRFRLQFHREARRLPVMTLRLGKGGFKLTPSKDSAYGGGGYGLTGINAKAWNMEDLARAVTNILGEEVVDKTGIEGRYDFDLNWAPENRSVATAPDKAATSTALSEGPRLVDVLHDRLGLTVARSVESIEVIVVDHVEQPSKN